MKLGNRTIEIMQYLILFLGMSVAAVFFQKTAATLSRFLIIVILSISYIFWGIWHHSYTERINKLVIMEYSLVSLIVILLSALGLGIIRFY